MAMSQPEHKSSRSHDSLRSESRRGILFRLCNIHTQKAIIELRAALEAMGASSRKHLTGAPPNHDEAESHIKQAMEVLLASGSPSAANGPAIPSALHKRLDVSAEILEWLSMTYSPRKPPTLNFDPEGSYLTRQITDVHIPIDSMGETPECKAELARCMDWNEFDVFNLHQVSAKQPLSTLAPHLFQYFNLYQDLKLNKVKVKNFWLQVETGYRDVPYHNCTHAADVLQVVAWQLNTPALRSILTPLEICAALVAAGIHDHDHPGVNNDFLIKTHHELALRYNDRSVLENHHASSGLMILQKLEHCHFLNHLDKESFLNFRQLVVSMVLATDMSGHFQLQAEFETQFEKITSTEETLWKMQLEKSSKRELLLDQVLHCADLSNCGKPYPFAEAWGELVVQEFFSQGDQELKLGLPVSPMNNRKTNVLEKSQMAFIMHIVKPMLEVMTPVIPELEVALEHANNNIKMWDKRARSLGKISNDTPPPS